MLKVPRSGFLKNFCAGILTYTGLKTGFHTDISPRNQFSLKQSLKTHLSSEFNLVHTGQGSGHIQRPISKMLHRGRPVRRVQHGHRQAGHEARPRAVSWLQEDGERKDNQGC